MFTSMTDYFYVDLFCLLYFTHRNIYFSFVDGNNDGHHAALYNGNPSPKKQEDLHLLNEPTAEV